MKHIFTSMALLIAKIAMFGVRKTHVWLAKNKCTYNVSLFGVDFGQETSYFFENEAGQAATVNNARYRDMITQFFLPKLDDIDVANMWFQQDATCHIANETIQLLHETFPDHILSHFGN